MAGLNRPVVGSVAAGRGARGPCAPARRPVRPWRPGRGRMVSRTRRASAGLSGTELPPQTSWAASAASEVSAEEAPPAAGVAAALCWPRPNNAWSPSWPTVSPAAMPGSVCRLSREGGRDREDGQEGDAEDPPGHGGAGRHGMPGRGQHDADRGEHRGPDRPETGSGGRRVGVRHGRVIIALRLGLPYGRSETSGASVAGPLRRPSARRVLEPIVVIHRGPGVSHRPNEGCGGRRGLTAHRGRQ